MTDMAISCSRVRDLAPGFVLGALEMDEMNAVRDHLRTCEKDHTEFDELGGVVSYLATTVEPMEPPSWLRESVLAAAEADLRSRHRADRPLVAIAPAPAPQPSTGAEVIPFAAAASATRGRRLPFGRRAIWITRIAAAVAVLALVGYAAVVQVGLVPGGTSAPSGSVWQVVVGQSGVHSADLAGVDAKVGGKLALLPSGHVDCWVWGLAPATGNQAYVVWLSIDGAPMTKVGTMPLDGAGSGSLQYDEGYPGASLRVQITLEANGAVAHPTGPIQASGLIAVFAYPAS
jgi:Putative zinc-finger